MQYENRTCCPNCQRSYHLSEARLNTPNLMVRCPACQTRFLASEHSTRIAKTPKSSENTGTGAPSAPVSTTQRAAPAQTAPKPSVTSAAPTTPRRTPDAASNGKHDPLKDILSNLAKRPTRQDRATKASNTPPPSASHQQSGAISPEFVDIDALTPKKTHNEEHDLDDEAWLSALLDNNATPSNSASASIAQAPVAAPTPKPQTKRHASVRASLAPTLLWGFGCLLLLALLLVQYAIFNIDHLVKKPNHKNILQQVCSVIPCDLPNADIDMLNISGTGFSPSKSAPNHLDLSATLTNQSQKEQLYPNLLIQLYYHGTLVGDAAIAPKDYLLTNARLINAGTQTPILLSLGVNDAVDQVSITPFY